MQLPKAAAKPDPFAEGRPDCVFRVGVTGTRKLPAERHESLQGAVATILQRVRDDVLALSRRPEAEAVYRQKPSGEVDVKLRIVSPLAEGADRLVAEAALDLGYRLFAPLPFGQGEYVKDFPATAEAFAALAARGEVFELDGGRGADENASYEAVGQFVVRNCDLVIALWDGEAAHGQGGTADIVRFAARSEVPVWWIDVATATPKLINKLQHYRHPDRALAGTAAEAALSAILAAIVLPPLAPPHERHGIIGRLAHRIAHWFSQEAPPLAQFVAEAPPRPSQGLWLAYGFMLNLIALRAKAREPAVASPAAITPVELWWDGLYRRADGLSVVYGDRYRSSYVLIIGLAFLALAVAVAASSGYMQDAHRTAAATAVEAILLVCIAILVLFNHMHGWQERWITYRLLAELCRKQMVLAPLGRTLPGAEVNRSATEAAAELHLRSLPREAWVGWYFLAALRSAPQPPNDAAAAVARALTLGRGLVAEQTQYHRNRRTRMRQAEHRLALIGEFLFGGTVAGLLVRLVFLVAVGFKQHVAHIETKGLFETGRWIETVAILFPSLSAAFVGLRAYAEFALLARQSQRMHALMEYYGAELDDISVNQPLASRDLGALLHHLAMDMLQEVGGWAQLFRLKAVETG